MPSQMMMSYMPSYRNILLVFATYFSHWVIRAKKESRLGIPWLTFLVVTWHPNDILPSWLLSSWCVCQVNHNDSQSNWCQTCIAYLTFISAWTLIIIVSVKQFSQSIEFLSSFWRNSAMIVCLKCNKNRESVKARSQSFSFLSHSWIEEEAVTFKTRPFLAEKSWTTKTASGHA